MPWPRALAGFIIQLFLNLISRQITNKIFKCLRVSESICNFWPRIQFSKDCNRTATRMSSAQSCKPLCRAQPEHGTNFYTDDPCDRFETNQEND